jgi:hypothetical protein
MKALDHIFNCFLYLVCLVFGLAVIAYAGSRAYLANESLSWTETSGQVVASDAFPSSAKGNGAYTPRVIYQYTVSGAVYHGNEISYGFSGFSFGETRAKTEQRVAEYPVGANVRVFYNPGAPGYSCIKPGGKVLEYFLPMLAGFLTSVFGAAQGWRTLKTKRL